MKTSALHSPLFTSQSRSSFAVSQSIGFWERHRTFTNKKLQKKLGHFQVWFVIWSDFNRPASYSILIKWGSYYSWHFFSLYFLFFRFKWVIHIYEIHLIQWICMKIFCVWYLAWLVREIPYIGDCRTFSTFLTVCLILCTLSDLSLAVCLHFTVRFEACWTYISIENCVPVLITFRHADSVLGPEPGEVLAVVILS